MVADGTVPCPLSGCTERRHEIRTDRSGNPYIACRSWKNSVWLNRGLGTEWLARNNGGSIRENPNEEPIAANEGIETPRRTFPCPGCGTPVPEDSPRCPGCGEEILWENPDGRPAQVERGIRERHQGRVSDVQRVFEKMRREVESGEGEE